MDQSRLKDVYPCVRWNSNDDIENLPFSDRWLLKHGRFRYDEQSVYCDVSRISYLYKSNEIYEHFSLHL